MSASTNNVFKHSVHQSATLFTNVNTSLQAFRKKYLFRCYKMTGPSVRAVQVCGCLLAEIVGSNPTGGMDVGLLRVLCVVRERSL
jgi:hypothetical protein